MTSKRQLNKSGGVHSGSVQTYLLSAQVCSCASAWETCSSTGRLTLQIGEDGILEFGVCQEVTQRVEW